jgi:uncharacterized protein
VSPESIVQIIIFVVFGFLVGIYGTMIGAGGGFIIVPVLLLVFNYSGQQAAGTSLAVVFFNAVAGSFAYMRQKRIDYRTGLMFAAATVPGALIGTYFSQYLTSVAFSVTFGIVLLGVSLFIFFRPVPKPSDVSDEPSSTTRTRGYVTRHLVDAFNHEHIWSFNMPAGIALSFVVGFMSSILGIGGGIIHVPAMVFAFSFPAHIATATSHFILAITAFTGSISHLWYGDVVIATALPMAFGVIFGARIGAVLSRRVQSQWIVRLLAVALSLVGARLILKVIY